MLNQKNLSNKRLSLTSIGLLIVSIFLIFGARIIVSQLSLMAVLSAPELFAYVPAFCVAGYVLMAAGIAGFLYVGLRSRFQVDTQRIKTQSRKLKFSIVALTCLMMCTSFLMTAPIVSANTVATTGYYLATPLPIADWYLGNYSTGNIFAINGSSWANLMTYPAAAPWASVTGNYTAVWENVLAATSYGTIYAKEVAFPLSLHTTIPNNTQVICNYQGVTYTFTNSTNSMGSPYTVETGAVKYDTTMYTAKDSGNRILWSSTNASYIFNTVLNSHSGIGNINTQVKTGTYTTDSPITIKYSHTQLVGLGSVLIKGSNLPLLHIDGSAYIWEYQTPTFNDIKVKHLNFQDTSASASPTESIVKIDFADGEFLYNNETSSSYQGSVIFEDWTIQGAYPDDLTDGTWGSTFDPTYYGIFQTDTSCATFRDMRITNVGTGIYINDTIRTNQDPALYFQSSHNQYYFMDFRWCNRAVWYPLMDGSATEDYWYGPKILQCYHGMYIEDAPYPMTLISPHFESIYQGMYLKEYRAISIISGIWWDNDICINSSDANIARQSLELTGCEFYGDTVNAPYYSDTAISIYSFLKLNSCVFENYTNPVLAHFGAYVSEDSNARWYPLASQGEYLSQNTTLWLPMNETSGTTIIDYSASGNNATATGTTISDGKRVFDGTTSDYVTASNAISRVGQSFTFSAWVTISSFKNSGGLAYYTGIVAQGETSIALFDADNDGGTHTMNDLRFKVGATALDYKNIALGTYHIVATYDANFGNMYMYVNGTLIGGPYSSTTWTLGSGLNIGRDAYNQGSAESYFNGTIWNVSVFSIDLSKPQIKSMYSVGITTLVTTPVSLY